MKVIQQTSTRLVFTHADKLLLRIALPLLALLYLPAQNSFPLVGFIVFLSLAGVAWYTRYAETYVFDKSEQQFTLTWSNLFRQDQVFTKPLQEITQICMQTELSYRFPRSFVILILASTESLKLPLQASAFSKEEQTIVGCLLSAFLDVPIRYQEI